MTNQIGRYELFYHDEFNLLNTIETGTYILRTYHITNKDNKGMGHATTIEYFGEEERFTFLAPGTLMYELSEEEELFRLVMGEGEELVPLTRWISHIWKKSTYREGNKFHLIQKLDWQESPVKIRSFPSKSAAIVGLLEWAPIEWCESRRRTIYRTVDAMKFTPYSPLSSYNNQHIYVK